MNTGIELDLRQEQASSNEFAPLRIFSVCAKNFLPQAEILFDSVRKHHPEASLTVYLCDRDMGYDPSEFAFSISRLESLGIPDIEGMVCRYNITELCTAIKPYCFLNEMAAFEDRALGKVIYLDPDFELFSPLEEVDTALSDGAQMVLTPHVLGPAERTEFPDQHFLRFGVYNLGFLAVRNTKEVRDLMRWWGRRLVTECIIDLENGLFVDQKWADLFPSLLENVRVLRHPGYNIAYWNLPERRIHGSLDALRVNNEPLRCVHYSGVILKEDERISRHSQLYGISNSFGYGDLVKRYRKRLETEKNRERRKLPYGFLWNGSGGTNVHTPGDENETIKHSWRRHNKYVMARQYFSHQEYAQFKRQEAREIQRRRDYEAALVPDNIADGHFSTVGKCFVCGQQSSFITEIKVDAGVNAGAARTPDWRTQLVCENCGLPNKDRAFIHLFLQDFQPDLDARILLGERGRLVRDWFAARFSNLASEFSHSEESDLDLSADHSQFDFILSVDTLASESGIKDAFQKASSQLTPGGWYIFTSNADLDCFDTRDLTAEEKGGDGQLIVDDGREAPLCLGWDVLGRLREAGFRRPFVYHYWKPRFGYLGPDQATFVAEKLK